MSVFQLWFGPSLFFDEVGYFDVIDTGVFIGRSGISVDLHQRCSEHLSVGVVDTFIAGRPLRSHKGGHVLQIQFLQHVNNNVLKDDLTGIGNNQFCQLFLGKSGYGEN